MRPLFAEGAHSWVRIWWPPAPRLSLEPPLLAEVDGAKVGEELLALGAGQRAALCSGVGVVHWRGVPRQLAEWVGSAAGQSGGALLLSGPLLLLVLLLPLVIVLVVQVEGTQRAHAAVTRVVGLMHRGRTPRQLTELAELL